MTSLRARLVLCLALVTAAVLLINAPRMVDAQGLVKGVEKGAREGNKAAGPVGGVLGGAIGGMVGVVGGVVGAVTGNNGQPAPAPNDKQAKSAPKGAKGAKATADASKDSKPVQVLTQNGAPQLTAEQIVSNNDAEIDRIKKELNLTEEQKKQVADIEDLISSVEKVYELFARKYPALSIVRSAGAAQVTDKIGGKGGNRTLDPGIVSRLVGFN